MHDYRKPYNVPDTDKVVLLQGDEPLVLDHLLCSNSTYIEPVLGRRLNGTDIAFGKDIPRIPYDFGGVSNRTYFPDFALLKEAMSSVPSNLAVDKQVIYEVCNCCDLKKRVRTRESYMNNLV